ncbi:MAG TPA: hypothetical protein GX004_04625 [Firmicutes bacterium]|jgi:hypothetical protein|nr:hypothetical protein [Bacillota bacterium]
MLGLLLLIFLGPIILFLIISLFFLPFHFALYSVFNIFTIPYQLFKIAFNKRLRVNHALEHATINVIEERLGCLNLAGMGQEDGFIIQGPVDPYLLETAARVGLERLIRGESDLAIHRRCGTSMLAANLISSVLIIFLLWTFGYFGIFYVLFALIAAQFLGPHLGKVLQKYVTTSTDVDGMEIVGVERKYENRFFFLGFGSLPGRYFIRTRRYNFL